MNESTTSIEQVEGGDTETRTIKAKDALNNLTQVDPSKVICMMAVVVTEDPTDAEPDRCATRALVLGGDYDIAKMFMTLATITRNSVIQANTPSNPNNETTH